ncbi:MAG: DUF2461 domain-containing protein [Proteobacteria bacterium]|nr:DUF2461 domain-containing protein [Pseudomonadota bacterium]
MSDQTDFTGFPEGCLDFFKDLARDNSKTWFDVHRRDYEELVLEPARRFVVAMGRRLKTISPGVHADPRANQSLFRINRDTRFSKDKTPYKTNVAVWFWEGSGPRMDCSGYYMHAEPSRIFLGAGIHCFSKNRLQTYREAVVDAKQGPALVRALKRVEKAGPYTVGNRRYKKVPRGFDPEHKNAGLLLHDGLSVGLETEVPDVFHQPEFVDYCFTHYQAFQPLHDWLLDMTEREA